MNQTELKLEVHSLPFHCLVLDVKRKQATRAFFQDEGMQNMCHKKEERKMLFFRRVHLTQPSMAIPGRIVLIDAGIQISKGGKVENANAETKASFKIKLQHCVLLRTFWYRVIHKKLSHKTEDKMQEKMKMILQVDEILAHI